MTDLMKIDRLLRRPQFLAAAKGVSQARGAVVIQQLDRADGDPSVRLGFTATLLTPLHGRAGCDYVFIARMGTADRDWDRLLDDVKSALTRLATPRAAPDMGERAVSPAPIPTRASSDPRPADQDR